MSRVFTESMMSMLILKDAPGVGENCQFVIVSIFSKMFYVCTYLFLAKIFIIIDAFLRFKNFQTTCFNTNTRVHTILLNITTILLVLKDVFLKKNRENTLLIVDVKVY